MPSLQDRLRATGGDLVGIFDVLFPGASPATTRLRADAIALCHDPGARGALILGPPGSGKSTLARAIALGRYLHLLTPDKAQQILDSVRVDPPARIQKISMNWYEELALTGLVTELADMQLFGIVARAATGVEARTGIFRQAGMGHHPRQPTEAALLTGGVVFLDEIGDLPPPLQPKLLTVLTGAEIAPVGGESAVDEQYRFDGLTLAATWKDPVANDLLRRDLVSRLSDHVLRVPSLTERTDDLPLLINAIISELRSSRSAWLQERATLRGAGLDVERATGRLAILNDFRPTPEDLRTIRQTDWDGYGDLRGLAQVLRRSVEQGIPVSESVQRQLRVPKQTPPATAAKDALFQRLLEIDPDGHGLPGLVHKAVREIREELVEDLRTDRIQLARLANHLGVDEGELRRRLADVSRDRRGR
jgi:DNA-binding NtrC family response regulator